MFQLAARLRVASKAPIARSSYAHTTAPRFFSSQSRLLLKEDADRSPEEVEAVKQKQLNKQKDGKGHWHEELASAGEANIAADKDQVHDHEDHMEDLQKETAGKAEKEHPHGKA